MRLYSGKSEIIAIPLAFTFEREDDWQWRTLALYIGPFFIALEWRVEGEES